MSKGDLLEMEGVIQDALGGGQYTIKVDQGGAIVRAQLSGSHATSSHPRAARRSSPRRCFPLRSDRTVSSSTAASDRRSRDIAAPLAAARWSPGRAPAERPTAADGATPARTRPRLRLPVSRRPSCSICRTAATSGRRARRAKRCCRGPGAFRASAARRRWSDVRGRFCIDRYEATLVDVAARSRDLAVLPPGSRADRAARVRALAEGAPRVGNPRGARNARAPASRVAAEGGLRAQGRRQGRRDSERLLERRRAPSARAQTPASACARRTSGSWPVAARKARQVPLR